MEGKEEARSNGKFEQDPLSAEKAEKELLKLIGGSRKARDRSLFKKFGLVLKTDHIDDDLLDDLEEDLRDDEHFFIDHPVAVHIRLLPVLRTGQALEEPSFILFTANAQKQGYVSNDSNKALRFMFAYS
ncbi:unnamed protein product [Brassica rapa]|uniref:Uncharacterized protein n=2 Tax=Brassica TaxID=3705 RepID=A0A3P5YL20_BRACM|nr:unnamed protein product [Brassica napus]CAG7871907.1 unnamed protein product [Brassica rapa]VDC67799.1 unnamed protein product [Brassica rapa]